MTSFSEAELSALAIGDVKLALLTAAAAIGNSMLEKTFVVAHGEERGVGGRYVREYFEG